MLVELVASVSHMEYLGWDGVTKSGETADLTEECDQSVSVVDVQFAIFVVQVHQTTIGF